MLFTLATLAASRAAEPGKDVVDVARGVLVPFRVFEALWVEMGVLARLVDEEDFEDGVPIPALDACGAVPGLTLSVLFSVSIADE